ncbi:hypothetical protein GCM10027395_14250 [Giesbergeria sinuosa]
MHCIKRLGKRVMSRTFEHPANELHIWTTILNRFTELGRPQTMAVAVAVAVAMHLKLDLRNNA